MERAAGADQTLEGIARRLDALAQRVEQGFHRVDDGFGRVDARFDQVDARFDRVDARFDRVETDIRELGGLLARFAMGTMIAMTTIIAALLGVVAAVITSS